MPVPRGRVVGGSSAINGQVLLRGIPEDYDAWAALGNDQWSFTDCLPYLRKLETDMDFGTDDFHNSDGFIPVRRFGQDTLAAGPAGVLQRRPRRRPPPRPRHEPPGVGRRRPHPDEQSQRRTHEHVPDLPERCPPQAQPDGQGQRNRAPRRFRGQQGCWRGGGERRRAVHRRRRPDHPLFRGHCFAPGIDAVGRRAGGPPARTGHLGGAGRSRRGAEPCATIPISGCPSRSRTTSR